jgi:hypothetical protein
VGPVEPESSPMFAAASVSLITNAKVRECQNATARGKITPTDARGIRRRP